MGRWTILTKLAAKSVAICGVLGLFAAAGLPAGDALALTLADCNKCHAGDNLSRHHNLVNPPPGGKGYDCLFCHRQVIDPVSNTYVFEPFRDCSQCHTAAVHFERHGFYITDWMQLSGVEPGAAPLWTQITAFTLKTPAMKEYQACYRCHSYAAFGAAPNGVSTIISRSGVPLTDQAMEFNPNNPSAHPVQVTLNQQTGSSAPRALTVGQMSSPLTNVGNQTIKCGDCHAAPVGPQGTATKFLLKGPRVYWPHNRNGRLWTLGDLKNNTNNWSADLFCKNCHPLYSGRFMNNVHDDGDHLESYRIDGISYRGIPCVSCHTVIPHGARRSRLMAYGYQSTSPDPPPYIINANTNLLRGFKKARSPWSYDEGNCWSTTSACDEHDSRAMTYDP